MPQPAGIDPSLLDPIDPLPLRSRTPIEWGRSALADPISLLIDHAFLEKKAANNAMELMTHWPGDWLPGWVDAMTAVARDEAAHLAHVVRLLSRKGGKLARTHKNPYANALRLLVRKGDANQIVDRLFVSALIELRSCERFAILARAAADGPAQDADLSSFYGALCSSEMGHYKLFLKLARKIAPRASLEARWLDMLESEARIMAEQPPGPRIHSGWNAYAR